jgi:hypothetical protein
MYREVGVGGETPPSSFFSVFGYRLHTAPKWFPEALFSAFWATGSFWAFLACAGQIAFKKPLETHFKHFWCLLANCLSGTLWKLILCISSACWPNNSQDTSEGSFWAFLAPAGHLASDGHFRWSWRLWQKMLKIELLKFIFVVSGACGRKQENHITLKTRVRGASAASGVRVALHVFLGEKTGETRRKERREEREDRRDKRKRKEKTKQKTRFPFIC